MITNRLSRILGERRLSLKDVERGTDLSYQTIWDFAQDRTQRYDRHTLDELCTFLNVDMQQLLEWQPDAKGTARDDL